MKLTAEIRVKELESGVDTTLILRTSIALDGTLELKIGNKTYAVPARELMHAAECIFPV